MVVTDYGKTRWVICAVGALFILARICFKDSNLLFYIVAAINSIAFLYVTYSIVERCIAVIKDRIKQAELLPVVKLRRCRKVNLVRVFSYIFMFLIVITYVTLFRTPTINDVIAICTVVISIVDDSIVQLIIGSYRIY